MEGGPYPYTVTSFFTNYPGFGVASGEGEITLVDPCDSPFDLSVGTFEADVASDYSDAITWEFPDVTVNPSICAPFAEYTCSVVTPADYTFGQDLCEDFNSN